VLWAGALGFMREVVGEVLRGSALRVSAVVWTFGYTLVSLTAMAEGRSGFLSMMAASLPLWVLGLILSTLLSLAFDRLHDQPPVTRWIAAGAAGVAAGAVQTAADLAWLRLLALTVVPDWRWALSLAPGRVFIVFMLYGWSMLMLLGLAWAGRSGDAARRNEARAAMFEAASARAELAALRLQLNPHFLFNTLNSIESLVVSGRKAQAEEMIGRLADFLRSSLSSDPSALIALDQELATVRAYLHIEEARFGDRLAVSLDVDPALANLAVPNFLLQPLVENAMKHGASGPDGRLRLSITARTSGDEAIVSIENSAGETAEAARMTRTGGGQLGLANTRHRLQRLYGGRAGFATGRIPGGFRAELRLPLVVSPQDGTQAA